MPQKERNRKFGFATVPARILIADDNPAVRACVARLVGSHTGWEVCGEASSGEEAIQKAEQLSPDLVVLDFRMPGINGIEAARRIVQSAPQTPILLCTIFLSRQLNDLARDVGIRATISKVDLNRIVPCIESILRDHSSSSPV